MDNGGLVCELLTLAIAALISATSVVASTSHGRRCWFTGIDEEERDVDSNGLSPTLDNQQKRWWQRICAQDYAMSPKEKISNCLPCPEYLLPPSELLGVMVGLALYHGVPVHVPLPSALYKELEVVSKVILCL